VAKQCKTKAKMQITLDTQVQNAEENIRKKITGTSHIIFQKWGDLNAVEFWDFINKWCCSNNVNFIIILVMSGIMQCWHVQSNYVTNMKLKILGITVHREE